MERVKTGNHCKDDQTLLFRLLFVGLLDSLWQTVWSVTWSTSCGARTRQVIPSASGASPVHLIEGVGNTFQDKRFCIVKVSSTTDLLSVNPPWVLLSSLWILARSQQMFIDRPTMSELKR